MKAGPAVWRVLGHQCDLGVLKQFEVAVHPDGAQLFGALLPDDLRDRTVPLANTWGAVRAHLR